MTHRLIIGVMLFLSFVGLFTHRSVVAAKAVDLPTKIPVHHTTSRHTLPTITFSPQTPTEVELTRVSLPNQQHTSDPKKSTIPFYSQFADISSPSWQKVGCGIASLAMIIDHYSPEPAIDVDSLLSAGIKSGAYIDDAGWSHAGLIALARQYDLTGESKSLSHLSLEAAFTELVKVVKSGPVMASVHYTFEPTNPIPHLVVISGVEGDEIIYSDPAETSGNHRLSVEKFKRSWKKRYIEIRPI